MVGTVFGIAILLSALPALYALFSAASRNDAEGFCEALVLMACLAFVKMSVSGGAMADGPLLACTFCMAIVSGRCFDAAWRAWKGGRR